MMDKPTTSGEETQDIEEIMNTREAGITAARSVVYHVYMSCVDRRDRADRGSFNRQLAQAQLDAVWEGLRAINELQPRYNSDPANGG